MMYTIKTCRFIEDRFLPWLNVPSPVRTVICFRDVASGRGWRWDLETWMSMRSVAFVWALFPPPHPTPPHHHRTHTHLSLQSYFFASRLLCIVSTLRVGAEIIGLSVPKHHTRRAVKGIPFPFVSISKFHDKWSKVTFCEEFFDTKARLICLWYF